MAHAHFMLGTLSHIHTHTHTICNTYCCSAATVVARTPIRITLHVHFLSRLHQSLFSIHFRALKNSIFSLKRRNNHSSIREIKCPQYQLCYAFNAETYFNIKVSSSDQWQLCYRCKYLLLFIPFHWPWAGITQSVQLLATVWTVRGSNPSGGEIFHTRLDRPWDLRSLLYNGYQVFPAGKAAGGWC